MIHDPMASAPKRPWTDFIAEFESEDEVDLADDSTAEERSERARKAWITRKANAGKADAEAPKKTPSERVIERVEKSFKPPEPKPDAPVMEPKAHKVSLFSVKNIKARRFLFNPKTGEIVLGSEGAKETYHENAMYDAGLGKDYDKFSVHGYLGTHVNFGEIGPGWIRPASDVQNQDGNIAVTGNYNYGNEREVLRSLVQKLNRVAGLRAGTTLRLPGYGKLSVEEGLKNLSNGVLSYRDRLAIMLLNSLSLDERSAEDRSDAARRAWDVRGRKEKDEQGSRRAAKEKFYGLKTKWSQVNNDLLEHIDNPGSTAARAKMDELKSIVKEMYRLDADPGGLEGIGLPGEPRDMVIIGAGPGGLAAAVMGGADGLDTLFIDANTSVGGQAKYSSRIENYPGFPIGTTGKRLAENLHDQALRVGAEGKLGVRVTGLSYDAATGLKTVTLSNGEKIEARSVIVAGGVEFRKADFPGSDSKSVVVGDGEHLSRIGAGKSVVVIGGSNGAAQAALGAARHAKSVTVVARSELDKSMSDYQVTALLHHPRIKVIQGDEISALKTDTDGNAKAITLKSGGKIDCDALGLFIGSAPNTSWLPPEVKRTRGKVEVDDNLETGIPGVFAVGDVRVGSIGRIGSAVGDGQMAQRNVFQYFERVKKEQEARR